MGVERIKLSTRSVATVAAICLGGGIVAVGASPAVAGHEKEECREAAPVPHPFVKLIASQGEFDADCLAVPADRKFRIYFDNHDRDAAHNVSIYATGISAHMDSTDSKGSEAPKKTPESKPRPVFKGKAFKGPAQEEYAVDELPAGRYHFQCDTHPDAMAGTLEVLKKK